MNLSPQPPEQKNQSYSYLMLLLSLSAIIYAVYDVLSFTAAQMIMLGVAVTVFHILNLHQFRIPRTKEVVSAKQIIIFWGAIWLGIGGAVLLTAVGLFSRVVAAEKRNLSIKIKYFKNILLVFAASGLFYLIMRFGAGFEGGTVGSHAVDNSWLFAATISMAAFYYITKRLIGLFWQKIDEDENRIIPHNEQYSLTAAYYVCTVLITFLLHYSLIEFGLMFGWVILALVVIAHTAYKFYIAKLEQKTKEIFDTSRMHLATVEALATAIDARDQVGIGHVRRTQIYAVGIGEALGLPPQEIQALKTATLLHDIGKLAVPDHILNKPGRLTPSEMEKMKIHSTVGASILEKVGFPYPVVPIVRHHHEMWDGSGYPDGLKGDEIPLTARILTVADAYDSLRGKRTYRDAVSRDEARKFLLSGGGKQFDPKVVDIFLRHLSQLERKIEDAGLCYSIDKETDDLHSAIDADDLSYVHQIKRANREVFTLYELAKMFSSSLNLESTLSLFIEKIGELVPYDTCAVYLLDEKGEEANAYFVEGRNDKYLRNMKVQIGQGATGFVLQNKQPVCQINPSLDLSFIEMEGIEDYTAMVSLPLLANEKLIGAVSLYSCELDNYGEEHLRLLETVSKIASDAIGKTLYHAETENKALTDPMTGLPNARSLLAQFEKEVSRSRRLGTSFQVLMLDLDGFKSVNDTFGHKVGDRLLSGLAEAMSRQLRDYDFLARYAGDEFVALIPETEPEDTKDLIRRLEKAVREFRLDIGDGRFASVGVSIGAASYPAHGSTLDQMIVEADREMYRIKAEHKQERVSAPAKDAIEADASIEENRYKDAFIVEVDESHVISAAIN